MWRGILIFTKKFKCLNCNNPMILEHNSISFKKDICCSYCLTSYNLIYEKKWLGIFLLIFLALFFFEITKILNMGEYTGIVLVILLPLFYEFLTIKFLTRIKLNNKRWLQQLLSGHCWYSNVPIFFGLVAKFVSNEWSKSLRESNFGYSGLDLLF